MSPRRRPAIRGGAGGATQEPAVDPYTPRHGSAAYRVSRYELELDYRVEPNRLAGRAVLHAVALQDLQRLEIDLSAALPVDKVSVNGIRPQRFSHRGNRLALTLAEPVAAGAPLEIALTYAGTPRPLRSTWGHVGWEELEQGSLVASQPTGAPSWFPCNDHPSQKATYRIEVTCDSPFTVVCPGELVTRRRRASRTTWVYEQHEPMATYLAVVHVGPYQRLDLTSSRVPQTVWVPPGLEQPVRAELEPQDRMMRTFEAAFGPYPFARYDVVVTPDVLEIPLEAQGMSTFGRNYLTGQRTHERLVAHELAHQWFGNCLTVQAWRHIWLNEGFACYAEWLWAEAAGVAAADERARQHWARVRALPQDLVLADPGAREMFDDRVYKRGALTVHALRLLLGDAVFFETVRSWVDAHRHGTVTTEMFRAHVASRIESTAVRLQVDRALDDWLLGTRLPALPGPGGR